VGLLALLLILTGGVAYAATALPRLRDGSLGLRDLSPAVGATQMMTKTLTTGADPVAFFSRPDIGILFFDCQAGPSYNVSFALRPTSAPASAYISGSDIADSTTAGSSSVSVPAGGLGGGVGYPGGDHAIGQGHVYVVTSDETMHAQWFMQGCTVRTHITIDRVPGAGPAFRQSKARPASCGPVTGAATCRVR